MPHFFVDDAFDTSKEVMSIPARSRNAAVGLWVRCGAWSAANLTDGLVPADVVRSYAGRATTSLVGHLVESTLWEHGDGESVQFRNWAKWQRTAVQVREYRERQAEKKRQLRAQSATKVHPKCDESAPKVSPKCKDDKDESAPNLHDTSAPTSDDAEMSPGDTLGDKNSCPPGSPQTPIPTPIPKYLTGSLSSSGQVSKPPAPDTPPTAESATPGAELVRAIIPNEHPAAIQTMLRIRASELINDGTSRETVEAALRLWLTKPHLGPNVLPSLVSEVIRSRDQPATGKPHKMRVLAELAQRTRAQEQAELNPANRKELA